MPFDRFLAFYKASPQDRRDGYGPELFSDLNPDEQAKARRMLLQRALAGNTIDLNALLYVGNAAVADALQHAQETDVALGYLFSIERLQTLFRLTDEPDHLEALFLWIDGKDADAQRIAAQALSRHSLPNGFAEMFVQRLASGRYENIALPLVTGWLAAQGEEMAEMAVLNRHLPFIRAVIAARPARRAALLTAWEDV